MQNLFQKVIKSKSKITFDSRKNANIISILTYQPTAKTSSTKKQVWNQNRGRVL